MSMLIARPTLMPVVFRPAETTLVSTIGAYSFVIPDWCNRLDAVLLGAGGGGACGNTGFNYTGNGGDAGEWRSVTLVRGIDFDGTPTITGSVGSAGIAGLKSGVQNGGLGGSTTAVIPGVGSLSALGGIGGTYPTLIANSAPGSSPGSITVAGQVYTGGAQAPSGASRTEGNPPGGGGGGGTGGLFGGGTDGMEGSRGQVWFRAYTD